MKILNQERGGEKKYCRIEDFKKDELNNYKWVIACEDQHRFTEIVNNLIPDVSIENIVDVLEEYHDSKANIDPSYLIYKLNAKNKTLSQWYIEEKDPLGACKKNTQFIADSLRGEKIDRICEIGPGTGVYTENFIEYFNPHTYEYYELNEIYRKYLYEWLKDRVDNLIPQNVSGCLLDDTKSESSDLVVCANVFPALEYSFSYSYLKEMVRACKHGGFIAFNLVTEESYSHEVLKNEELSINEWRMIAKELLENIMKDFAMTLYKTQILKYYNYDTRWYIFKK